MTRTLVSFEAAETLIPPDRSETDEPPGRVLALLVSGALRRHDIEHEGANERGGWAWDLLAGADHASIECIVGLVDDAPRQWLIVTTIRPRRRLRKRARYETEAAAGLMRDSWIRALADFCDGTDGLTSVRWYDQETFDRDHGETWAATPFA